MLVSVVQLLSPSSYTHTHTHTEVLLFDFCEAVILFRNKNLKGECLFSQPSVFFPSGCSFINPTKTIRVTVAMAAVASAHLDLNSAPKHGAEQGLLEF